MLTPEHPLERKAQRWRRGVWVGLLVLAGVLAIRLTVGEDPNATALGPPHSAVDSLNRPIAIAPGTFVRGSPEPEPEASDDPASPYWMGDESVRRMSMDGFWMQEHEVTNAEYRRFDASHDFPAGRERHPVVNVTWREAMAYAASIGGTLPTEAQWEFAARGRESRIYPWGDDRPTCARAHYADCAPRSTVDVLSRPEGATPEGIHGLAGNVWEWVMPDWFELGSTPINTASRRLRGGSFEDAPFFLRAANRNNDFYDGYRDVTIGFRVVWAME